MCRQANRIDAPFCYELAPSPPPAATIHTFAITLSQGYEEVDKVVGQRFCVIFLARVTTIFIYYVYVIYMLL